MQWCTVWWTMDREPDHVELAYEINMSEFEYGGELPLIPAGVPVGLQFVNTGIVEHEAVIGDSAAQDNAEQMLQDMGSDETLTHGERIALNR